jgi:hypothetical protein
MSKPVVEYNPGPSAKEGPAMAGAIGAVNSCCVLLGGAYGAVEDEAMLMVDAIGFDGSVKSGANWKPPASTENGGKRAEVGIDPVPFALAFAFAFPFCPGPPPTAEPGIVALRRGSAESDGN